LSFLASTTRGALFVPRVIAIVWPTKYITPLTHPVFLAELFGARFCIVVARA